MFLHFRHLPPLALLLCQSSPSPFHKWTPTPFPLSLSLSHVLMTRAGPFTPTPHPHTPPSSCSIQPGAAQLLNNKWIFLPRWQREIGPLLAEDDMVCGRLFMGCSMNVHVPVQIYAYCTECRRLWQFRNMAVHGPICIAAWLNFQYWYTLTQM